MMNQMFGLETTEWLKVYVEGICCCTTTSDEYLLRLKYILAKLKENGLTVKLKKCNFAMHEIVFLGHLLSGTQIKVLENKNDAILKYPQRTSPYNV